MYFFDKLDGFGDLALSILLCIKYIIKILTNKIIELNNMAIAFLKDSKSEPWMLHPKDKSEGHIARGKLSRAITDSKLNNTYRKNLTIITQDLAEIRDMVD